MFKISKICLELMAGPRHEVRRDLNEEESVAVKEFKEKDKIMVNSCGLTQKTHTFY